MLTPADYSEWLDSSGLYLANVSHADRYRTFEGKISRPGLDVRIVFDFLGDQDEGVDVASWRNFSVYEMERDLRYRVERTAEALAAIGAPRAAEAVRNSQNTTALSQLAGRFLGLGSDRGDRESDAAESMPSVDPAQLMRELRSSLARALGDRGTLQASSPTAGDPNVESREEIERRLVAYAAAKSALLAFDQERYGDVRKDPGFDPESRRRELDEMADRERDRRVQEETAEEIGELIRKCEKGVAKFGDGAPQKLRATRRKLLRHRRDYATRPTEDLLPELSTALAAIADLEARRPEIFRLTPSADPAILAGLAALGAYRYDVERHDAELEWDHPQGFDGGWTTFSLQWNFPEGDDEALRAGLKRCDRLRRDFPRVQEEIRVQAFQCFLNYDVSPEELEECGPLERDASGQVTEASILKTFGPGSLQLDLHEVSDDGFVDANVYFSVPWDEEHGLELPLEL